MHTHYRIKEGKRGRQKKIDKIVCEVIFEQVLQVERNRFEIKQVIRLGKYIREDKYRLLLVKFRNGREKCNILS